MSLPPFRLLRPRTVEDALGHLVRFEKEGIQVCAGGTDLLPSMKQRLFTPAYVMDIRGLEELTHIRVVPGMGVELGGLVKLSAIEDSGFVATHYPVLREAVMTVASPILRNMGTLGGNLCLDTRCLWYNQSLQWRRSCGFCIKKDGDLCHVAPGGRVCWAVFSGDTAAALLCLHAEIEIAGPRGRRRIPLAEFYTNVGDARMRLGKDEILTRIFLPEAGAGFRGVYKKLRLRGSIDYPLAGVAVAIRKKGKTIEDARVAITGVNPAPHLVKDATHALIGRECYEHAAMVVGELAARVAKPLTTSLLTPEYRREMIKVMARRAVIEAARD
jgi:4-hydroxybenzoyl-CoA reductase subunit beta